MSDVRTQRYIPTPTLERFHGRDANVRGVLGPVGSGKSVGMCIEIYFRALEMPAGADGVRRSRWAAIRNTYPELKSTTVKTWEEWMPMAETVFDSPIRWRWQCSDVGDGTGVDLEVLFLSMDRPADVKKLKSLEITGAWMNEAVELPKEALDMATGRVGRYPRKDSFAADYLAECARLGISPYWSGVIADTNACDDDHWWYQLAEVEKPLGYEFFHQPPALIEHGGQWVPNKGQVPGIPHAENIEHQPKGWSYYLDQVPGKSRDWIKVYLAAEYGTLSTGRPVYGDYDDMRHCSPHKLRAMEGVSLRLGWDFGLTPACVIAQMTPRGQLVVLEELTTEYSGLEQFAEDVVKPHLAVYYPGYAYTSVGDPAKGTAQTDARTCYDILDKVGIPTRPARTNILNARVGAVTWFLTRTIGREPAFLLSPACAVLRKGFRGAYQYQRMQVIEGGEVRYKDEPLKNKVSHPHDALQYIALEVRSMVEDGSSERVRAPRNRSRGRIADARGGY